MKTCRIDLHVHTSFSMDGVSRPEEMVAAARSNGLDGIVLTDHNTCEAVPYLIERGLMRADGRPVDGFLVLPGVEVTTDEGHLLCIGAVLPAELKGRPVGEVLAMIRAAGGLPVPAHPYDLFRAGIREAVLDALDLEALEVFNAATTFKRYNRRAYEYALRRGLIMTAGSDAHHHAAVGVACTIVEVEEFSTAGVLAGLRRGTSLSQRYLSTRQSIRKTWNNLFRLRRRNRTETTGVLGDVGP